MNLHPFIIRREGVTFEPGEDRSMTRADYESSRWISRLAWRLEADRRRERSIKALAKEADRIEIELDLRRSEADRRSRRP